MSSAGATRGQSTLGPQSGRRWAAPQPAISLAPHGDAHEDRRRHRHDRARLLISAIHDLVAGMLAPAARYSALAGAGRPCATPPGLTAPHKQPWRPGVGCTQRRQARHWQRQRQWQGSGGGSGAASTAARRCLTVCAAHKKGGSRERLPIFPLGMVALPAADVPLQVRMELGGRGDQ